MSDDCVIFIFYVLESATSTEKEHLHSELRIMRKVSKHIHVVGFLGCCTVEGIRLISLSIYLTTHLTHSLLIIYMLQQQQQQQ